MQLTLKIAVVFIFFSLILFGFSQEETVPAAAPVKIKTEKKAAKAVKVGELPDRVNESSGIEEGLKPGTFYTHNDAGNAPEIFKIDAQGNLLGTYEVAGAENIDWEDITKDNKGNIYIGDIGNNSNKRKQLKIYKLLQADPNKVEVIEFEYADRKNGTIDKKHNEFDCEAMFWHRSKLYLITKDRDEGVNARLYELSDKAGVQEARPISNYDVNAAVTSADISPDGKTMLLLSEGNIHLFQLNGSSNFFAGKMKTLPLGKVGQTEGAVFTSNTSILVTNEDGKIFRYQL